MKTDWIMRLLSRRTNARGPRPWLITLLCVLLAAGALLTYRATTRAGARMRMDILAEAQNLARGVHPDHARTLTGTADDLRSPVYERLKTQLIVIRSKNPLFRCVYLAGREPTGLRMLVDSERPGSEPYRPPGAPLRSGEDNEYSGPDEGAPIFSERVENGEMAIVSVHVPITDPESGEVLAFLGIDMAEADWNRRRVSATVPPMLLTLALVALTLALAWVFGEKRRRPGLYLLLFQNREGVIMFCMGAVAALYAAWSAHEQEERRTLSSFHEWAGRDLDVLQHKLDVYRDTGMVSWVRLFEVMESASPDAFDRFASSVAMGTPAREWGWAPVVRAAERSDFEVLLPRRAGRPLGIWERDHHLRAVRAPARHMYFPLRHMEPRERHERILGFDLSSVPEARAAMEEAARTRLATATEPLRRPFESLLSGEILVMHPLYVDSGRESLRGFVLVTLSFSALQSDPQRTSFVRRSLNMISPDEPSPSPDILYPDPYPVGKCKTATRYVEVYGKVVAITARSTPAFHEAHPRMAGRRTAVVGLVVTAALAVLVGIPLGQRRWLAQLVEGRTRALRDARDRYERLLREAEDVGRILSNVVEEQKLTEHELRLLNTAIEQSPQIVMITDAEGKIEYVNTAFVRVTGYSRKEAIGQTPRILKSGAHDDAFYTELWNTLSSGEIWSGQIVNRRKNGEHYTEEAGIAPVRDEEGMVSHYVAIKRDISDELEREKVARQAQKLDSVGRLAGGIAHDFNNMLQVILGNAELALRQMDRDGPLRKRLEEIRQGAQKATTLTRQLMAFASRQPIRPVVMELNQTVDGMLTMLRRMIPETIDFVWQPAGSPKPVKMDPSQVDQIVMNLVSNASEAIEDTGRIIIATDETEFNKDADALHEHAVPGVYVVLSVRDTGCGMDHALQRRIFEPFFSTKKERKGSGLGLSTVYGIVRQNKGFIDVNSAPGKGTIIKVYLPRHTGLPEQRTESGQEHRVVSGHETILLVEDEPGILRVTRGTLEKLGYTVYATGTPQGAIRLAEEHAKEIQLLLTDVIMPKMNGWDLAVKIRSICPDVKCLYMSGYSSSTITKDREINGKARIMQKPFTLDVLAEQVRAALDQEETDGPDEG